MKKILLSAVALLSLTAVNAQVDVYTANDSVAFSLWTAVDLDGDGFNFGAIDLTGTTSSLNAQGGCAISNSWSTNPLTPDNLFSSPVQDLSNVASVSLSWAAGNQETTASGWFEEYFAVYVVNDLTAILTGTFPTPVYEGVLAAGEVMEQHTHDVTAQAAGQATVYVVVRHFNCTNENYLVFDDVKLTATAFVSTEEKSLEVLSAYPNPTTDVLNITLNENATSVSILGLDGKLISTDIVNSNIVTLNVADLAAGVYFYEVVTAEGDKVRNKFIKK